LKFIIILGIILLVLFPTGAWIFAGIFLGLIYYTYRKNTPAKSYKKNQYDTEILEEMK